VDVRCYLRVATRAAPQHAHCMCDGPTETGDVGSSPKRASSAHPVRSVASVTSHRFHPKHRLCRLDTAKQPHGIRRVVFPPPSRQRQRERAAVMRWVLPPARRSSCRSPGLSRPAALFSYPLRQAGAGRFVRRLRVWSPDKVRSSSRMRSHVAGIIRGEPPTTPAELEFLWR
jgi:hypothetical protein